MGTSADDKGGRTICPGWYGVDELGYKEDAA